MYQTAFERVPAPGYERRPDVGVAALTLQLPLEGKLHRGGVVGVIKTADGRWLHAQQHGAQPDFFISTREVCSIWFSSLFWLLVLTLEFVRTKLGVH